MAAKWPSHCSRAKYPSMHPSNKNRAVFGIILCVRGESLFMGCACFTVLLSTMLFQDFDLLFFITSGSDQESQCTGVSPISEKIDRRKISKPMKNDLLIEN